VKQGKAAQELTSLNNGVLMDRLGMENLQG